MNKIIYSFFVFAIIITITSTKTVYSNDFENGNLIIAMDTSIVCKNERNSFDLFILYQRENDSDYYEVYCVKCKTEPEELSYALYYENKKGKFVVFMEYSSPTGLSKFHYFDIENKKLYSTDFFEEAHIPLLTSINIEKLRIQYLSLKHQECGSIFSSPIELAWEFKTSLKETIRHFKILDTIE